MNDRQIKIVCSALLHDIGKIVYRSGVKINHSDGGYEFLKNEIGLNDTDILDAVRYHHAVPLSKATLDDDSVAYITHTLPITLPRQVTAEKMKTASLDLQ